MPFDYDPYAILNLSKNADDVDINRAYERLVQRLHPGQNASAAAAAQYEHIHEAYNLLSDTRKRREYDRAESQKTHQEHYFTLNVIPSKRAIVPLGETQVVYFLADIAPSREAIRNFNERDARLNITLVLDQSNSMNKEHRMEKVKAAAQAIIRDLSDDDFISIVTFNNKATIALKASRADNKPQLSARVSMIQASGGTEIFKGLQAALVENEKNYQPDYVNHIILLTDGHTLNDEDNCLQLAYTMAKRGIGISTMGLGVDWNDQFLDELASSTGGSSMFISSVSKVISFMNDHVRSLANTYAERMKLSVATDPDVSLDMAFKLSPHPQPINLTSDVIPLSSLQAARPITVLLQFQMPANMQLGFRSVARIAALGDILPNGGKSHLSVVDTSIEVNEKPSTEKLHPPTAILDALSKLTLYQLQEKAKAALASGNINEATRKLQYLATRLHEMGESHLASQVLFEADTISKTQQFSKAGSKTIKYGTRGLIDQETIQESITALLTKDLQDKPDEASQNPNTVKF